MLSLGLTPHLQQSDCDEDSERYNDERIYVERKECSEGSWYSEEVHNDYPSFSVSHLQSDRGDNKREQSSITVNLLTAFHRPNNT